MNWLDRNQNTINQVLLFIGAGLFGASLVGAIRGCLGVETFGIVCYAQEPTKFISIMAFYGITGLFVMGSVLFQDKLANFFAAIMNKNSKQPTITAEQKKKILDALAKLDDNPEIKKIKDDLKKSLDEEDKNNL